MKLKDVILDYCNQCVPRLNTMIPEVSNFDIIKYDKAIEELKNLACKFNNLKLDCKNYINDLNKVEKNFLHSKMTLKEVFKKLGKKENVIQLILKEDVIRTFLQSVLLMSNIKEVSLGNKETREIAAEKIRIHKNLMTSLIIGCDASYHAVNNVIDSLLTDQTV